MNTSGANTADASRGIVSGDNASGPGAFRPVRGPPALGWSSHFGMGLFMPACAAARAASAAGRPEAAVPGDEG